MGDKLVLTKDENRIYYGYFHEGIPLELYACPVNRKSILGNIYAARVEKIATGAGGAFLELSDGLKCYYPLKSNKKVLRLNHPAEVLQNDLKGGDIILVQVVKDAVKTKLSVADSNISLAGAYFVISMVDRRSSISRKITDSEERKRLSDLVSPYKCDDFGIVVRTNAAYVADQILVDELRSLINRYQHIVLRANNSMGKTLIYELPPHYISLCMDLPRQNLTEIITDIPEIYEEYREYFRTNSDEETLAKLRLYSDDYPLSKLYRFEHFYKKATDKLIWLNSGGSIVIEQTEAMVVVDVNTGTVTKSHKETQDIFYKMNCEAAKEIAYQLRLRNLSGIIMIDFINLKDPVKEKSVMEILEKSSARDRVPARIVDITKLGIVEMTRAKKLRPLHEQLKIN